MGNLSSNDVCVKIKDENHLYELFGLCKKYNKDVFLNPINKEKNFLVFSQFGYFTHVSFKSRTEVTTEQFEEILKSEQQCQK